MRRRLIGFVERKRYIKKAQRKKMRQKERKLIKD